MSGMRVGFLGLGVMGYPMASNMVRAGTPLIVWNRTAAKAAPLRSAGAEVAESPAAVLSSVSVVMLMLRERRRCRRGAATGDRGVRPGGCRSHRGPPGHDLAGVLPSARGRHPGRRGQVRRGPGVRLARTGGGRPARRAAGGRGGDIAEVRPLLEPVCRSLFVCGDVPDALRMKLAVNLFLITMVTRAGGGIPLC